MKVYIRYIRKIIIAALMTWLVSIILKIIPGTDFIYSPIMKILITVLFIRIVLYILKNTQKLRKFHKPLKIFVISAISISIALIIFLFAWYNYCFFPNDQDFIQKTSDSAEYRGNYLEDKELDLISNIHEAKFKNYLSKKDRKFLLSSRLKEKDIYIDENPYGNHPNNLKYATGKIFYYTYQKNSIVLNVNSNVIFKLTKNNHKRFLEFDAVLPLSGDSNHDGIINIYYISDKNKLLLHESIKPEKKPDIKPFRYSNILESIAFYIQHPGRSVLKDTDEWQKIRVEIPSYAGRLKIEFKSKNEKNNYLFIGSPALFAVKNSKRNEHVNVVYILFDLFSKDHIDLYEYYDEFSSMSFNEAVKKLGERKIITPAIDKYKDNICLFENMFTAGQVTRPSIVALWTSQTYTKCRMPVFRNIVTDENKQEFYRQNFTTLANELSKYKYFTKQISCNAQGHGVSGVGADLGFDENYDYTMEPSELPENFRRIIEFLNENQNRKFFLYSHINVPHTPKWIPAWYFLSSLPDTRFNINSAKILGNIRYLNDSLDKVMQSVEKLKLMKNTIIIITADHTMGTTSYLRGELTDKVKQIRKRESQSVADYYYRAIYTRKGTQFLLNDFMNIPWLLIKPDNLNFIPGKIDSYISSLDISPTLIDIVLNKKEKKFSGNSFKDLLINKKNRQSTFNDFIPLVGRFQNGFILNGRYKYYINLQGMYKYKEKNGIRYLMHQEYLYDFQNDPCEINNLAYDLNKTGLIKKIRKIYFEKYTDYPDKNFIQISASPPGKTCNYSIEVHSIHGKLIYPRTYGDNIKYHSYSDGYIVFSFNVKEKPAFISFETDPADCGIKVVIYKNGKLIHKNNIFSAVENINYFNNPIIIKDRVDFHIACEPGKTGLEVKDIPEGSISFYRIPLIYWMEMSLSDKDIKLSPGIKEVLRGWGYIQ